jgi:hypothetical protein
MYLTGEIFGTVDSKFVGESVQIMVSKIGCSPNSQIPKWAPFSRLCPLSLVDNVGKLSFPSTNNISFNGILTLYLVLNIRFFFAVANVILRRALAKTNEH